MYEARIEQMDPWENNKTNYKPTTVLYSMLLLQMLLTLFMLVLLLLPRRERIRTKAAACSHKGVLIANHPMHETLAGVLYWNV